MLPETEEEKERGQRFEAEVVHCVGSRNYQVQCTASGPHPALSLQPKVY